MLLQNYINEVDYLFEEAKIFQLSEDQVGREVLIRRICTIEAKTSGFKKCCYSKKISNFSIFEKEQKIS